MASPGANIVASSVVICGTDVLLCRALVPIFGELWCIIVGDLFHLLGCFVACFVKWVASCGCVSELLCGMILEWLN